MNPVNINFDRPNFDKTNSARNLEVVNRWITDTADKLNVLAQKMVTGEVKVNEAASIDYSTIRNIVNKTSLVDLIAAYDTYSNFPETGKRDRFYLDQSTGDMYLYGAKGNKYSLISSNYEKLNNLPQISGVTIKGNRGLDYYGVETLTNLELESLLS